MVRFVSLGENCKFKFFTFTLVLFNESQWLTFISSQLILSERRFIGKFRYLGERVMPSANKLNLKKLELLGKSLN